jgi:hypothetical protein
VTKIETIIDALDNPSRTIRARRMFELMEDERRAGVEDFITRGSLDTAVKMAVKQALKEKEVSIER